MFFSLFGIVSKIAQFIGPVTISAVTGATQNTHLAFILCAITAVLPLVVVAFINMERADVRLKVYEEQERRKSQQPILGGDNGNEFSDRDTDDDIMNSEGENEVLYVPPITTGAGSIPSITPSSNNTNNHQKSSDGYNNYGYGL